MRKVIISLFMLALVFSCETNMTELINIRVTNKQFSLVLKNFNEKVNTILPQNEIVSISVWISRNDTVVGLYANKKLNPEYFLGFYSEGDYDVFVYSNDEANVSGIFQITGVSKIDFSLRDGYRDGYVEYYRLEQGRFVFISPSEMELVTPMSVAPNAK